MVSIDPLVYILVLNYCSYEDTVECVHNIRKINYKNYKLLVIDNCSPDGSGEKLSEIIEKKEFVKLSENTGYAGGNNYGFEIALENNADYVFIVNPDIRLAPESVCNYVGILEKNKNVGGLNPVQLSPLNNDIDSRFKSVINNYCCETIKNNIGKNLELSVDVLFGASFLLSRNAIEKVGGFDPLYFAYGEELDLCRRLKYFNFDLLVTCMSPVIHLRTYETQPFDKSREFLRLKGRYLYQLKDLSRNLSESFKHFYYVLREDYVLMKKNKTFKKYYWL